MGGRVGCGLTVGTGKGDGATDGTEEGFSSGGFVKPSANSQVHLATGNTFMFVLSINTPEAGVLDAVSSKIGFGGLVRLLGDL
jgi:hypothetical protein